MTAISNLVSVCTTVTLIRMKFRCQLQFRHISSAVCERWAIAYRTVVQTLDTTSGHRPTRWKRWRKSWLMNWNKSGTHWKKGLRNRCNRVFQQDLRVSKIIHLGAYTRKTRTSSTSRWPRVSKWSESSTRLTHHRLMSLPSSKRNQRRTRRERNSSLHKTKKPWDQKQSGGQGLSRVNEPDSHPTFGEWTEVGTQTDNKQIYKTDSQS